MSRPRTASQPLDLTALADGPRTRRELDATHYALGVAEAEGVIAPSGKAINAVLWKLTRKGRGLLKKGVTRWPSS